MTTVLYVTTLPQISHCLRTVFIRPLKLVNTRSTKGVNWITKILQEYYVFLVASISMVDDGPCRRYTVARAAVVRRRSCVVRRWRDRTRWGWSRRGRAHRDWWTGCESVWCQRHRRSQNNAASRRSTRCHARQLRLSMTSNYVIIVTACHHNTRNSSQILRHAQNSTCPS